jgi:hypothetical protein
MPTSALGTIVETPEATAADSRSKYLIQIGFLICTSACCSLFMAKQMADDAYIYLRIAQNVVHRAEWSFNPGMPVNAATSPLYCLLLSGIVALHLPSLSAPLVIASALSLSALAIAIYLGVRPYGSAAAMLSAFVAITFPTLLRADGMENRYVPGLHRFYGSCDSSRKRVRGGSAGWFDLARTAGGGDDHSLGIPCLVVALWQTTLARSTDRDDSALFVVRFLSP